MTSASSDKVPFEPTSRARQSNPTYGGAVRIDHLESDRALQRLFIENCTSLTPEIELKWNAVHPHRDFYDFAPVDRLLAFAERHGLSVHGHALLWEKSTPDWFLDEMIETGPASWARVEEHFDRVLSRYAGRIKRWDVINEPIDTVRGSDGGLALNTFHRSFGEGYVARSLRLARAIAPDAQLMINDYSFEYDNPIDEARRRAFVALLRRLLESGVPLDAVGLQAHLDLGKGGIRRKVVAPFLRSISELGLGIYVTELDVQESDAALPVEARDALVEREVRNFLALLTDAPSVKGITTWGLSDRYSWLSGETSTFDGCNRGLPFDFAMRPKGMHKAIMDFFSAKTSDAEPADLI